MKELTKKNRAFKIIGKIIFVVILLICLVVIFFNFSHEYYDVLGPSMSPTINSGVVDENEKKDAVFVSKIKTIERGDIVVAKRDTDLGIRFIIKRIIAMGGDKIKIETINGYNRIVLIKNKETNQIVLEEEYLQSYEINKNLKSEFETMLELYNLQTDENGFLEIPEENVFYLGDNRVASIDSADYGYVKMDKIVGKVDYIIYGNTNPYGQVIQQFFGW